MKIKDFKLLIEALPFLQQSFTIKKSNWEFANHENLVNDIFIDSQSITLPRNDLFTSAVNAKTQQDLKEFIVKTLMWGYPTKGRGNNIMFLFQDQEFDKLLNILEKYKSQNVSSKQLQKDISEVKGLGLSTMSKFMYFLNSRVENKQTVILDQRIIDTINLGKYEELHSLKSIGNHNAVFRYLDYLTIIDDLKAEMGVEADKIEMFLFVFGKMLS